MHVLTTTTLELADNPNKLCPFALVDLRSVAGVTQDVPIIINDSPILE